MSENENNSSVFTPFVNECMSESSELQDSQDSDYRPQSEVLIAAHKRELLFQPVKRSLISAQVLTSETTMSSNDNIREEIEKDVVNLIQDKVGATSESGNTTVMDVKLVMEMFKDLKEEIKQVKKNTSHDSIQGIMHCQKDQEENVATLQKELALYKKKTQVLVGVVQHMSNEMKEIQTKLTDLERNMMKQTVVLSGYHLISTKKKDCIEELQYFLDNAVKAEVTLVDYYEISVHRPGPVVLVLSNLEHKIKLLQKLKNLKGYKNEYGKGYFLSEQMPAIINES